MSDLGCSRQLRFDQGESADPSGLILRLLPEFGSIVHVRQRRQAGCGTARVEGVRGFTVGVQVRNRNRADAFETDLATRPVLVNVFGADNLSAGSITDQQLKLPFVLDF